MKRWVAARIAEDAREEFGELRTELNRYLESEANVDQTRNLLAERAPAGVVARTQLLLDTLLNYLMEEAIVALTDSPTAVKNEFYDLDLRRRIEQSFTLEPESLEFSFDPRKIAGGVAAGVTATAGGLMTALLLCGLVSRLAGGIATLAASAFAFKITYKATTDTARKWLRDDVEGYVTCSEQQVSSWLASVEEYFVAAFEEFQDDKGQVTEGGTA